MSRIMFTAGQCIVGSVLRRCTVSSPIATGVTNLTVDGPVTVSKAVAGLDDIVDDADQTDVPWVLAAPLHDAVKGIAPRAQEVRDQVL